MENRRWATGAGCLCGINDICDSFRAAAVCDEGVDFRCGGVLRGALPSQEAAPKTAARTKEKRGAHGDPPDPRYRCEGGDSGFR